MSENQMDYDPWDVFRRESVLKRRSAPGFREDFRSEPKEFGVPDIVEIAGQTFYEDAEPTHPFQIIHTQDGLGDPAYMVVAEGTSCIDGLGGTPLTITGLETPSVTEGLVVLEVSVTDLDVTAAEIKTVDALSYEAITLASGVQTKAMLLIGRVALVEDIWEFKQMRDDAACLGHAFYNGMIVRSFRSDSAHPDSYA